MEFVDQLESINFKPRKKKKKTQGLEDSIQVQLVRWLEESHSGVLFRADSAAGIKLSIGQATKLKRMGGNTRGWPDFLVLEPNKEFHGMFLELKKDGVKIYKEDGSLYKNEHHQEQHETLQKIKAKGYYANFAIGLEDAKKQIENYLKNR